jgi:hypothetical protein
MSRARASVGADAIRIEDEVWQEAFRETTRPRSRPRLRSLDGVDSGPPRFRPAARRSASVSEAGLAAPVEPVAADFTGHSRPDGEVPVRRTVTITGRGAERNLPWPGGGSGRRGGRRAHERAGFKPDRVAMWAVLLGMLLLFVAALSAHV